MDPQLAKNIAGRLARHEEIYCRLRMGEVIDDSPLTVALGGVTDSTQYYADVACIGATPSIGDRIAALQWGQGIIVLGAQGTGGGGGGSYQPLDSDLTAIAALATTSFGRALLTEVNAASLRSTAGAAASSHTHAESDVTNLVSDLAAKAALASPTFTGNPLAPTPSPGDNDTSISTTAFVTAAITAAAASYQPLDSDLTSIAALSTTSYGRSLLTLADADALRNATDVPFLRVSASNALSWDNDVDLRIQYDTIDEQNDITFSSSVTTSGTGAKTNGGSTVTGTGTSFTTEYAVGDRIQVAGETRFVTIVTDNTHITVSVAWGVTNATSALANVTGKATITKAGLYKAEGLNQWATNATGYRRAQALLNGAVGSGWTSVDTPNATIAHPHSYSFVMLRLAVNDVVIFRARQNSGGVLSLATTIASLRWVGT